MMFRDRRDAGARLGARLRELVHTPVVVVGLPRGGVPVAFEVADALDAPLDVIVVRKLGLPSQPELAMGAIGEDGAIVLNPDVISLSEVSASALQRVEDVERRTLEERVRVLREVRPRIPLRGAHLVVVDDGVATGATARAACQVARQQGAASILFAVPVGPHDTLEDLAHEVDQVVCLEEPRDFFAVGASYVDFAPTSEDTVLELLEAASHRDAERHASE